MHKLKKFSAPTGGKQQTDKQMFPLDWSRIQKLSLLVSYTTHHFLVLLHNVEIVNYFLNWLRNRDI